MRIIKLSFKNLNSLVGSWTIDFDDAAYQNNGLFAITGETGAGKTTIFDAICLALYGTTPRLNDKGDFSENNNEIMSRQADHCEAEVLFQTGQGQEQKLFRALFSHRRKSTAKLLFGKKKWQLFQITKNGNDIGAGSIIDQELEITPRLAKEYDAKRREIIGLDYEQFCRVILLAQGDFKKFLSAKPEERAALLEKITGTEIYTRIGKKVSELYLKEKSDLTHCEALLTKIKETLLSAEEVSRLTQEQVALPETQKQHETNRNRLQDQIAWRIALTDLQEKFNATQVDAQTLDKTIKDFEPKKEALQRDERTLPLVGDYRDLTAAQASIESSEKKSRHEQEQLLEKENERGGLEKKKAAQQELTCAAQEECNSKKVPLQRTRELDVMLQGLVVALAEAEKKKEERSAVCDKLESDINRLKKETEKTDTLTEKIDKCKQQWTQEFGEQTGIDLATQLDEIKALQDQWKDLKKITDEIGKLSDAKKEEEQKTLDASTLLEKVNKETSELEGHCKCLDGKISEQEEHARLAQAVASLEEERAKLHDGHPCPLCGSLQHPLAFDAIPTLSEAEATLGKLKSEQKEMVARRAMLAGQKGSAETTLRQSQEQQKNNNQKNAVEEQSRQKLLADMNLSSPLTLEEIEIKIDMAEVERKKIDGQKKLAKKLEKEINDGQKELDLLTNKRQELSNVVAQLPAALEEKRLAETTFDENAQKEKIVRDERVLLLGDKNPDQVETELQEKFKNAQEQLQKLKDSLTKLDAEITQGSIMVGKYTEEKNNFEVEYAKKNETFLEKILNAGFSDIDNFVAARLVDDGKRKKLQEQDRLLSQQKSELQGKIKSINEDLQKEQAKNLTDLAQSELDAKKDLFDTEIKEIITKIFDNRNLLKNHQERENDFKDESQKHAEQAATTERWKKLYDLIGTKDNPKLTRMVQQITLETLLEHANVQLQLLAPRYELVLSGDGGAKTLMGIYCRDLHLDSKIRPVNNLSGGESFLISLALALGLSKMSSDDIAIGSLFLDEGFGTLDEATLHTALDALVTFQSSDTEQKLIGIISHVGALKERIANKIEVTKIANGKSTLKGPGVKG